MRRGHPAAVPESAEVADHRMDMEACRITWDERHHRASTGRWGWLLDVAAVAGMVLMLAVLMLAVTVLGELGGGWPA